MKFSKTVMCMGLLLAFPVLAETAKTNPRLEYEEACKGVSDGERFVVVKYPEGGFPLATNLVAQKDPVTNIKVGRGRTRYQKAFVVPAAAYCRAKVLVRADPDPKLDRTFTVRLTRYVDGTGYTGRDFGGMMNVVVDFDRAEKRQVGDKWEVDVPLDMGDICYLVWYDDHGTWMNADMRRGGKRVLDVAPYLDFEILCRLVQERNPMLDHRMEPDMGYRNGITVFGATLEKAGAELQPTVVVPGNVFEPDEKPETKVKVVVRRPGDYTFRWVIRDAEGHVLKTETKSLPPQPQPSTSTFNLDLAQQRLGWYALDLSLFEGARRLMTHHASFALLAADSRREGVGEGPYGSWTYGGNHYCVGDIDYIGPLMRKAGFRRGEGVQRYSPEKRHAYKMSPPAIAWNRHRRCSEEERVAEIRKSLEEDPNCRTLTLLHEDAPWAYQQAWELTGQPVPDPKAYGKAGWKAPGDKTAEYHFEKRRKRHELANEIGRIVRKHFPDVKITLGNSIACTELIAETVRDGFPEEYADYMGIESVVRTQLPERDGDMCLQMADAFVQLAHHFGYDRWRPNASWESVYRVANLLGEDRQAAWYVRDLLLEQAWRFPDIFIGVLMDCDNAYGNSFWGPSGLCHRAPYAYPKKSYVGIAVATRLLDQVVSSRAIPTGDGCVYAQEYARQDGKCVCALWTSRGTAEVTLDVDDGRVVGNVDFYGRDLPSPVGRRALEVGEFVRYVVTDGPAVTSAAVGRRTYPDWGQPGSARLLAATDAADGWRVEPKTNALLEITTGPFFPYRTKGAYGLKEVQDAERGRCLELTLEKPDYGLPTLMGEYAVVELAQPVPIAEDVHTLGAWVRGNSGWGQFYWIVEDAEGRRSCSCGKGADADVFDYEGTVSICYTGWNFLRMPLRAASPVRNLSTGGVSILWRGDCSLKGPLKLVGFAFSAPNRPLFLNERRPCRQTIRIGGIFGMGKERPAVVFVGAHPDDTEGFAGLAFLLARTHDLHVVDLTRGERGLGPEGLADGSTARRRMAEERTACARLGATPHFLHETDGEAYASREAAADLADVFRRVRPVAVFTHWPLDIHADHVQCAALVARALKLAGVRPERYFYEVIPCETKNWRPVYSVDISATLGRKIAMMRDYACQNADDSLARQKKAQAEQRGRERRPACGAAETFTTLDGRPINGGLLERLAETVRMTEPRL